MPPVDDGGGAMVRCLESLATDCVAGCAVSGDIRVQAGVTEAVLAVALSHVSYNGGWVDLPLQPQADRSPSLYVFHI